MPTMVRGMMLSTALVLLAGASVLAEPKVTVGKSGKTFLTLTAEIRPTDPFHDVNAPDAKAGAMKGVFRGDTFTLVVKGTPAEGWHAYPITLATMDQKTYLTVPSFDKNPNFTPVWPVQETQPQFADEGGEGIVLEHGKPFTWTFEVYVDPKATPGPTELKLMLDGQVCSNQCLPIADPLIVPVTILDEPAIELTSALKNRLQVKEMPAPTEVPIPPEMLQKRNAVQPPTPKPEDEQPTRIGAGLSGFLWFALVGMFWGAVSLVTPCVFPMIPITVSYFLKQAEKKEHSALKLATVYTCTVVFVLTIAAVALLSVFQALINSWYTNVIIGALFIYFALSLFGMYDIELPGWLSSMTSSREKQGGIMGTIFMALTFTIISFACVAPFLGGFGGTAASAGLSIWHRIVGGFAFALTFAAPFFVLALFPSLLKSLPRSGSWLNSVKVVMGFLELAAALKFLRSAELLFHSPLFFTYDLVLAAYVGICVLAGLYLLGFYRLPHDSPEEHIGVLPMLLGMGFLSLGLYLAPALFKTYDANGERTRPAGQVFSWIDSFLLPDEPVRGWQANLRKALAEAQKTGRRVFVDFTGINCTNCNKNEHDVFERKDVQPLLAKYVLVKLYTDRIPDAFYNGTDLEGSPSSGISDAKDKNLRFERTKFDTTTLPLYVILEPVGPQTPEAVGSFAEANWLPEKGFKEVGRVEEGLIQSVDRFKEFLEKGAKK
jgi:thiol:disulfide interchange protein DsbD